MGVDDLKPLLRLRPDRNWIAQLFSVSGEDPNYVSSGPGLEQNGTERIEIEPYEGQSLQLKLRNRVSSGASLDWNGTEFFS